jgi:hypothetical protein
MARNFLWLEVVAYVAFVGLGFVADYGAIYRQFSFSSMLSYEIVYSGFLLLAEMILTVFIFLHWYLGYYQISKERIVIATGIVRRRKTMIPAREITGVTASYHLFGKWLRFGSLQLARGTAPGLTLSYVPDPERYARVVMKIIGLASSQPPLIAHAEPDLPTLLSQAEHEQLEFKSSMRWDFKRRQINKGLERAAFKTIAAFLNSHGGHLILGVDDGRNVLGVEHDWKTLNRADEDGYETHFTHMFNSIIGGQFRHLVKLHFPEVGGKRLCVVQVAASAEPVYAKFEKGEEFFVRTGNSTTSLSLSQAASYISKRGVREA